MFKKIKIPESILLTIYILVFWTVYGFVSNDDYHKTFDIPEVVSYNCDMLIGGWHPDVPPKVIEECKKRKLNASTY